MQSTWQAKPNTSSGSHEGGRSVAFAPLLKARGARRVLDLGCGAGRHLVYLAREGFEMHGMDIAENGLAHAQRWLESESLAAELIKSDMGTIP
jgi:cyclopropane fatty-acyl-phospholipid synthase-like methyltransferase